MSKEKTLQDLFHDTLKDIYFAEKKILTALAEDGEGGAVDAACRPPSRSTRLRPRAGRSASNRCSRSIGETPKGKTCDAIMGLLEEGKEIMDEYKGMPALDAGLLAAAQAVEHYEISRYGTLKTLGRGAGQSRPP